MSDYLHNLIQCLAIAHIFVAAITGFGTFVFMMEEGKLPKRLGSVAVVLVALIPVTAAWLATYGGIR